MAKADGSYLKELAKIERQHLIVLDDFGLQLLDSQNRIALLEIMEDRHNKGSIIITSQIPVQGWYDIIGEKTIADYPHFFIMRSIFQEDTFNQSLIMI